MLDLNKIGVAENIVAKINSPLGEIKLPCTIDKVLVTNKEHKNADFFLTCNGTKIDITIAVMFALQDMDAQNERAESMEKKYNRHKGRYIVKDMAVDGVVVLRDGTFAIHFEWTDCYNCKRGYTGINCKVEKGVNGLFLTTNVPQFYF